MAIFASRVRPGYFFCHVCLFGICRCLPAVARPIFHSNWNGNIGARSSGTNSRTEIWQDGCKYFADELGITDYDLSSNSWDNCKYRYNQIVDGTLEAFPPIFA